MPAAFVRKADACAAEDPIDEPVAEVPAAAADGDGDDFLAGIEDELGLDTTAEKADEKPPVKSAEPSRPATTSHDDDLSEPARPPAPAFAVVRTSRPVSTVATPSTPERSSLLTRTARIF